MNTLKKFDKIEEIMNGLKDKVVIVTGSSKGIGATIAKTLASKEAALIINFATSK